MMKSALAAAFVLLAAVPAHAAAVLTPNPVIVAIGSPVHLTPRDQDGTVIPIEKCTIINVPVTLATMAKDATGMVLTAVGTGSTSAAQWRCTNDATTASSALFVITVPWSVTAVGHTSP